jgi:hypothetical protein
MTPIRAVIRSLCRKVVAWLDRTEPVQCTGVSAVWCPVCGNCTCADREQSLDDPCCPLHGEHSRHAEGGA